MTLLTLPLHRLTPDVSAAVKMRHRHMRPNDANLMSMTAETPTSEDGQTPSSTEVQPVVQAEALTSTAPQAPHVKDDPVPVDTSTEAPADSGGEVTFEAAMADPTFQREFQARQARAIEKALEKQAGQAKKEFDRAKMDEVQRLEAEKADFLEERKQLQEKLADVQADQSFSGAVMKSGVQLANADAAEFLRLKTDIILLEADVTWEEAVGQALKANPYLLKAVPPAQTPIAPPATTVPAAQMGTEAPAGVQPTKEVDVLSMTPQEYSRYKAANHGIH